MKNLINKLIVNYKYGRKINRLRESFHNMYMFNHFNSRQNKQYQFGYEVTIKYFQDIIDRYDVSVFYKIFSYGNMIRAFERHRHQEILKYSKCSDNKQAFKGSVDAACDARNAINLVALSFERDMLAINKI